MATTTSALNLPLPEIPQIEEYQSPYQGQIQQLLDKLINMPEYQSPYESLINEQLSKIINRQPFQYNPDEDPAYQAFLQRAQLAGQQAYANQLGALSAATGGRINSWAATVAAQAQQQYLLQAQTAMIEFEERAYRRYQDETVNMYNLLNALNNLDQTAYNRWRDQITDTKDLANFVLNLDEMEFNRYRAMTELRYQQFQMEYQQYMAALQQRQQQIEEAMNRTNMLGYVSNQDAIILGVPAGTLSQAARERKEAMEDYIKKAQIELQNQLKKMEAQKKIDLELIKAREESEKRLARYTASLARRSGGGGGGSSRSMSLTMSDGNKRDSLYKEFYNYTTSSAYKRLSAAEKYKYVYNFISKLVSSAAQGAYGKNSAWIANSVLEMIKQTSAYQDYLNYQKQYSSSSYRQPSSKYSIQRAMY